MTQDVKAQHTPGPWPWEYTRDGKRIVIGDGLVEGPNGYEVAEVYSDDCPREVAEANARLIAASPELLEALTDMVREASMLLQNAEGCAANHYGNDIEMHGEPQWITDSRARIVAARAAIAQTKEQP